MDVAAVALFLAIGALAAGFFLFGVTAHSVVVALKKLRGGG